MAAVVVDAVGEAHYQIYGDSIAAVVAALGDRIVEAVDSSAALFLGSNTLVGSEELSVTMRVRARALELDRPVIFDPNLRLERWRWVADAAASANACVSGALLVRATAAEAAVMTGEEDAERAAAALVAAGARLVVLTLGAARFYPAAAAALLRDAVAAGALAWARSTNLSAWGMLPPVGTGAKIAAITAGALLMFGGGALAAGVPDPLGSPGVARFSYCERPTDSACATVRETTHGHLSVITVVAPPNVAIKSIDIWTGAPIKRAVPKGVCRQVKKTSMPQYQIGTMYIDRCRLAIKTNHTGSICVAGLARLPSTSGDVADYPIAVYAGNAGGGSVVGLPPTSRCPKSASKH